MADFEKLQACWDETEGIDAEVMDRVADRVVQRHTKLKSTLDGRDAREISVCAILIAVIGFYIWFFDDFFIRIGSAIVVLACVEVAAVMLWARRGLGVTPDELSVRDFTLHQRTLIRRQIWLLRNIAWWYLLPFFLGVMVVFYGAGDALMFICFGVMTWWMYWWIWRMNQREVIDRLQPLNDAYTLTLEALDHPDRDLAEDAYEALAEPSRPEYRDFVIQLLVALVLTIAILGLLAWWDGASEYPKLSPFAAVRWQDDRPEVAVGGTWYELLKIDDVDASEIVDYCQWRFFHKSKKRFEEDLVEVLTRMGHRPGSTSTLTVRTLPEGDKQVLRNVSWTRDNRSRIKRANDDPNEGKE